MSPNFGTVASDAAADGKPLPGGSAPNPDAPASAVATSSPPTSSTPGARAEPHQSAPDPITSTAVTVDPVGDVTPSPLDPAPSWADLAGARLARTDGWELRITLASDPPPGSDADHTMNIAAFFDTDGDGTADYEAWCNLADSGWGASWFDNTGGRGRFGKDSGVTVAATGRDVVVRFPPAHLGGAERFRWSLASEWGRYEVLFTPAAARDDAPDNDQPASFPA